MSGKEEEAVANKILSDEQRLEIYRVIGGKKLPDDREPRNVIDEDYGGDENAYLNVMAEYHGVFTQP